MTARDPRSYDVFVILPEAVPRFAAHRAHLKALPYYSDGELLLGVDVYYRRPTDTALVALRLDPARVTRSDLEDIVETAHRAGVPVLQPGKLLNVDQQRFYQIYLASYDVRATDLPTPDAAMRVLARSLDITTSPPGEQRIADSPLGLDVRFRRGGSWSLGRLCSLTPGGVYVATSAPPRAGERIDLELTDGTIVVTARAAVAQCTSTEAASLLGAAGFGARFVDPDAVRADVQALIAGICRDGSLVAQPPRRRHVRYPVRIPVSVTCLGTSLMTNALDLSLGGLFVATPVMPLLAEVDLAVAASDGPPIRAHARVVRKIAEEQARARRMQAGFGAEISRLADDDGPRWGRLVESIARRSSHSVIVAASRARLAELLSELSAAGYAAAGVEDLRELDERLHEPVCPDVVVVDPSVVPAPEPAAAVTKSPAIRRATDRHLAVVMTDAESPPAVRLRVDEAVKAH
jgi:hypothetical protein